jgi:hypothetical protein
MQINNNADEFSYVVRGRELLEKGDIAAAVEFYSKAFDPESLDEPEARSMLIEARANLSRKFLPEALESFEDALIVGDVIQRRQAIEGIVAIAEIRSKLGFLAKQLKAGLKEIARKKIKQISGLASLSDDENLILISNEAIAKLPDRLSRGVRIAKLPPRLRVANLPINAEKCIPYSNEDDISYILEVCKALINYKEPARPVINHFGNVSMTGLDQSL